MKTKNKGKEYRWVKVRNKTREPNEHWDIINFVL